MWRESKYGKIFYCSLQDAITFGRFLVLRFIYGAESSSFGPHYCFQDLGGGPFGQIVFMITISV